MIRPIRLAQAPTPLEPLARASARLGVEVWVKRDDLTGAGLSGNKVRKLEYLLADARRQGARAVVTCGGIQSNHCRATAIAARRLGLQPILLLRGTRPMEADGNLLLDGILGARIHWTDAEGYRHRDARMAELARTEHAYVIPEGGSNATGALGYVRAGRELSAQALQAGIDFDAVICATGSGGTLAGLAMAGLDARVLGVAVCDDRATFRARVGAIFDEARDRFGIRPPSEDAWDVVEGFQGRGYALSTPEELRRQVRVAREEGLLLDPVYTGKAWAALEAMAQEGTVRRVLFWHTGGVFGLFGRGGELARAMGADWPEGLR